MIHIFLGSINLPLIFLIYPNPIFTINVAAFIFCTTVGIKEIMKGNL